MKRSRPQTVTKNSHVKTTATKTKQKLQKVKARTRSIVNAKYHTNRRSPKFGGGRLRSAQVTAHHDKHTHYTTRPSMTGSTIGSEKMATKTTSMAGTSGDDSRRSAFIPLAPVQESAALIQKYNDSVNQNNKLFARWKEEAKQRGTTQYQDGTQDSFKHLTNAHSSMDLFDDHYQSRPPASQIARNPASVALADATPHQPKSTETVEHQLLDRGRDSIYDVGRDQRSFSPLIPGKRQFSTSVPSKIPSNNSSDLVSAATLIKAAVDREAEKLDMFDTEMSKHTTMIQSAMGGSSLNQSHMKALEQARETVREPSAAGRAVWFSLNDMKQTPNQTVVQVNDALRSAQSHVPKVRSSHHRQHSAPPQDQGLVNKM